MTAWIADFLWIIPVVPLVVSLLILGLAGNARAGYLQQPPSSVHLLGTGRPRFLSFDRLLDRTSERGRRSEEGVHYHPDRGPRVFPRTSLALRQQRQPASV